MNWNDIAAQHYDWVERMGWHNKTTLESLALIASEVGESAAECLGEVPTKAFGEELADIVLRTIDLAHTHQLDVDALTADAPQAWKTHGLFSRHAELAINMGEWVNTARKEQLGPEFARCTGVVLCRVMALAGEAGIDLRSEVLQKMHLNEQRGTRGRRI